MYAQTTVKVAIASVLVIASTVRAETAAETHQNSPRYLIDYLSLNGEPLRQEDGEKQGRVFMITGSLNAFGSVALGLNKRTELNTPKGPEEQPPYYRKNLYALSESLHGIYLIRAEIRQKNSSYWQKVEIPNAFSRIIAPYDPGFDPYSSPPEPAGKDIGFFYISDYVLNNTGYFEDNITETVLTPTDFVCMPSRKYEELNAAVEEFNTFVGDYNKEGSPLENRITNLLYVGLYDEQGQDFREGESNEEKGQNKKEGRLFASATRPDLPPYERLAENPDTIRDNKAFLLKYKNAIKPMYDNLKALKEASVSVAAKPEEKEITTGAVTKLETVIKKADELRTMLKWVDFAYTSADIINFNAADCYVRDDKDKSVPYSARDGDELRIQIFRIEPPIGRADVKLYTQPALETEIHATFRDYGQFITISPALYYAAKLGSEFDSSNYNFFEKAPAIGLNIYWRYEGLSSLGRYVANYLPGLSLAALGYSRKITTAENETTTEDVDPKFSVGFHVCPFPSLRKYFTVYMMLYDFQWDNKLIGFSLAPGLKADKLFENDKSERIKIGR